MPARSRPGAADARRLWLIRALHTAIYIVMVCCIAAILYGGITGAHGFWLTIAAGLVATECLVFAASGLKCPLTAIAVRYGARHGAVFDTFLPERITRHTLRVFGPLAGLGLVLVSARALWLGWSPLSF